MTPIIEARGLTKRFGGVLALDGLNLVAETGGITALLGPNGAGKTTFVSAVATLLKPDKGDLLVAGIDVIAKPKQIRQIIGLAGQYATVEPAMTGTENLQMIGRLFGLSREAARHAAADVLERLGLTDAGDRLVRDYSGGMRRRLDHTRTGRLVRRGRARGGSALLKKPLGRPHHRRAQDGAFLLVSHPTPPVFDGPEDRNGTRNFDEIRLWADYITPGRSGYVYDDDGVHGGLKPGELFVIAGDQNSDPLDGDSIPGAIQQVLDHPLVNTKVTPSSPGAVEQSELQGGANEQHLSDPAHDTADFGDSAPGNLRADYVLPRKTMQIADAGVFWPLSSDPLFALVGVFPFPSSDHRLVWIDVTVPSVR